MTNVSVTLNYKIRDGEERMASAMGINGTGKASVTASGQTGRVVVEFTITINLKVVFVQMIFLLYYV